MHAAWGIEQTMHDDICDMEGSNTSFIKALVLHDVQTGDPPCSPMQPCRFHEPHALWPHAPCTTLDD